MLSARYYYSQCFTNISSLNAPDNPMKWVLWLILLYRWENWGTLKYLTQGHRANKWLRWDLNPGSMISDQCYGGTQYTIIKLENSWNYFVFSKANLRYFYSHLNCLFLVFCMFLLLPTITWDKSCPWIWI